MVSFIHVTSNHDKSGKLHGLCTHSLGQLCRRLMQPLARSAPTSVGYCSGLCGSGRLCHRLAQPSSYKSPNEVGSRSRRCGSGPVLPQHVSAISFRCPTDVGYCSGLCGSGRLCCRLLQPLAYSPLKWDPVASYAVVHTHTHTHTH